jgi:Alpha/beta hydrolase domain
MKRSLVVLAFLLWCSLSRAELIRFEITQREPFAEGLSFGDVGPYEKIAGRAFFALDPSLRQNHNVIDLKLAPRNEKGRVEFWADLYFLAPADPTKGNGALLYDVNNRGNKLALGMFNYGGGGNNPTTREHAGDGFLMRHGFTIVWSGWDGELIPGGDRLRLMAPAVKTGGELITGMVRCEFVPSPGTKRMVVNWANHGSYRPTARTLENTPKPNSLFQSAGRGDTAATLTVRVRPAAPRVVVPRDQWTLHVADVSSDSPTQLPNVEIELPGGMQPGCLYELIYEASDPLVMGVCFTSVRDLVSALKNGTGEGNPLVKDGRPIIRRAHGFGVSQSGRFLREFLYWGFNEDERERQVFDGVIPHVAGGGLGSFNHRFAQPTRHSNQHDHHDYPPDRFPFAYETQTDPLSGQTDGILKRAVETKTAPLVMHTQSASEYWTRSGSLPHTDPLGRWDSVFSTPRAPALRGEGPRVRGPDVAERTTSEVARKVRRGSPVPAETPDRRSPPLSAIGEEGETFGQDTVREPETRAQQSDTHPPDRVRFYTFGGTQHGPSGWPLSRGAGQNLPNPGDYKPFLRVLLLALDRWAKDGTEPPPSICPKIADETLVDWRSAGTGFPNIPGVNYPETIQQPSRLDFGPRWQTERIIDFQPPKIRGDYKVLAPRCGPDGNELGCLLPPEVAVPVATYTGWNLRKAEVGAEGELVALTGSYIPFPTTKADRERTGDPRLSVQERYGSLDEYTRQFTAACDKLKAAGYLFDEDAERLVNLHRERVAPLFMNP